MILLNLAVSAILDTWKGSSLWVEEIETSTISSTIGAFAILDDRNHLKKTQFAIISFRYINVFIIHVGCRVLIGIAEAARKLKKDEETRMEPMENSYLSTWSTRENFNDEGRESNAAAYPYMEHSERFRIVPH